MNIRIHFVVCLVLSSCQQPLPENSITRLVSESSNYDVAKEASIENLDKIGGFRGLKLNTTLSSLDISDGWIVNDDIHPTLIVVERDTSNWSQVPDLFGTSIENYELGFVRDTLAYISLDLGDKKPVELGGTVIHHKLRTVFGGSMVTMGEGDICLAWATRALSPEATSRVMAGYSYVDSGVWQTKEVRLDLCALEYGQDFYSFETQKTTTRYTYKNELLYTNMRFSYGIIPLVSEYNRIKRERIEKERRQETTQLNSGQL